MNENWYLEVHKMEQVFFFRNYYRNNNNNSIVVKLPLACLPYLSWLHFWEAGECIHLLHFTSHTQQQKGQILFWILSQVAKTGQNEDYIIDWHSSEPQIYYRHVHSFYKTSNISLNTKHWSIKWNFTIDAYNFLLH